MENQKEKRNTGRYWLMGIFVMPVLVTLVWMAVFGQSPIQDSTKAQMEESQAVPFGPVAESEQRIPAPDVILKDNFDRVVTLKGAMPTPRYYYFWASWCGVCEQMNPLVAAAYQKYGAKIDFYAINLTGTEEPATLKQYIADHPFPFVMLFDPDGVVVDSYGVKGTPTQVFISKSGQIVEQTYALSAEDLDQRLSSLLSQE